MGVFKKTMKDAGKDNVEMIAVKNADLRPYEDTFVKALEKLKTQVEVRSPLLNLWVHNIRQLINNVLLILWFKLIKMHEDHAWENSKFY